MHALGDSLVNDREQALRTELVRFTAMLLREARARTGWTHKRLHSELVSQGSGLCFSSDAYKKYLRAPDHPQSRGMLAERIQALENRVADIVGRPRETVVIWNFSELADADTDPLWVGAPPRDFQPFGEPGKVKMRGIRSNHIELYYPQLESTYLRDLISHAEMWPSLVRAGQLSSAKGFDIDAQRNWLLTWQRRIQDERKRTSPEGWQRSRERLSEDFRAICDAPAGTLPIIPTVWPEDLIEQLNTLQQLLGSKGRYSSAGILPESGSEIL